MSASVAVSMAKLRRRFKDLRPVGDGEPQVIQLAPTAGR